MPSGSVAQDIRQGVLQLRWGDPPPGATAPARGPAFEAWLEMAPGRRVALDAAQARRAAGDLYALSNRRVAVSYRTGERMSTVDAIVPVDVRSLPAAGTDMHGRAMVAAPVRGSTRWVTVMCKFGDVEAEQRPPGFFQGQYGDAPGQLGHYWSEVSYGQVDLAGSSAHGWYRLPRPRGAYVALVNGVPKVDLTLLFADCTALAETAVDFEGVQGINLMFNAELDGRAWGGGACGLLEGLHRCTRATWNPPWAFVNLSGLAHEMGHGYGLPHADNSDGDGDTHDNPWDLMSDAWRQAVTDPVYGLLPKHPGMYQRDRLGWVAAERKQAIPAENDRMVELRLDAGSAEGADGVQLVLLSGTAQPDPFATVVHTLEARRRTGAYESRLAGDAVIIHTVRDHGIARSVDTDVPAADFSGNEGSMLKVGESWTTPDGLHRVHVVAETATGFIVRIAPRPRLMSSPMPAREGTTPVPAAMRQVPPPSVQAPRLPVSGCTVRLRRPWSPPDCLRWDH